MERKHKFYLFDDSEIQKLGIAKWVKVTTKN